MSAPPVQCVAARENRLLARLFPRPRPPFPLLSLSLSLSLALSLAMSHYPARLLRSQALARLRDIALCWMFLSLASTGFLEKLKIPTDGALSMKCLPSPCH